MKVLIYGNHIFSVDMAWGFEQAGHSVTKINAQTAEQITGILNTANADILMTLGAPPDLKSPVMAQIGKRQYAHYKHIHWDTDGISSTFFKSVSGDGIEMDVIYLSKPDLVFTMCPQMQEMIRSKGFPCEFMHYAYSPMTHRPMPQYENRKHFINLIGNSYYLFLETHPDHFRYYSLKVLLKPLMENGYPVHIFGERQYPQLVKKLLGIEIPQGHYHGYLPYERTSAGYNSSFINLITQNHPNTITKRTFEILGSGGFALSADNEALRKLFVPGRDLEVSSSPEQTLEIVQHYWDYPEEWRIMRENAVLSVQNHTYKQRAEFVIQKYNEYWPTHDSYL